MSDYPGKETFKLGFGYMRLPHLADGSNDIKQIYEMVDLFMEAGGTYFDTAYVYDGGRSEEALKASLIDRYPRSSYTVCTKMNAWLGKPSEQQTKRQLEISLKRTGLTYFDYYLLHALQPGNWKLYDEYGLWDYVAEQKQKGILKNIGFSYHADPELLDKLLTRHPEVDFIQLQINYADWDNPGVEARANYEVAMKHNVPITVMEPVKGGALANPINEVKAIFDSANENASYASWAIRYAASLDKVITVLSGMSSIDQMKDNLSYMRDFKALSGKEREVIKRAQLALAKDKSIPCTGCRYCVADCPSNIPIPDIIALRNAYAFDIDLSDAKKEYERITSGKGKASQCVFCHKCAHTCPQHLGVPKIMRECSIAFE
ncbi:MAG: aldo/keto reductase [Eggerthellaceae bacterium]|nr:aldo/keto reductase [Eggerthellaceae bacterium]